MAASHTPTSNARAWHTGVPCGLAAKDAPGASRSASGCAGKTQVEAIKCCPGRGRQHKLPAAAACCIGVSAQRLLLYRCKTLQCLPTSSAVHTTILAKTRHTRLNGAAPAAVLLRRCVQAQPERSASPACPDRHGAPSRCAALLPTAPARCWVASAHASPPLVATLSTAARTSGYFGYKSNKQRAIWSAVSFCTCRHCYSLQYSAAGKDHREASRGKGTSRSTALSVPTAHAGCAWAQHLTYVAQDIMRWPMLTYHF